MHPNILPGEDQIENVGAPNHINVERILVVTNEECLLTTPVLQVSSNWKILLRGICLTDRGEKQYMHLSGKQVVDIATGGWKNLRKRAVPSENEMETGMYTL